MLVTPETAEDCKKYFQHCWVKFKEEGEKIFYITHVDKKYIHAKSIQDEEILVDHQEGYTIDYLIPKKTVFQHGECAVMLSRIPARMWKKGMNKVNTEFKSLDFHGWTSREFDMHIINGFVNKPCYYSAQDALNDFAKSEHLQSAALTPRISISRKGTVYVDTIPVGRWLQEKKTLSVKKIFNTEVKPLFSIFTTKDV
jgi:hypothetical protein